MKRSFIIISMIALVVMVCGAGTTSRLTSTSIGQPSIPANAPAGATYSLIAWTELGMHCIDGRDYSIFSVLPPYNVIHAQLVKKGEPPTLITSGVTITYQATADSTGSINTKSGNKTNFWTWVQSLFLVSLPKEAGLAGYNTQSLSPQNLSYNATLGFWEAVGIPTVPYDDNRKPNAYPMVLLVAKNSAGTVLAQEKIVLSVSDELSCNTCHASGSDPNAMPKDGWVNNPNKAKDTKLNILRKHDDKWDISGYLSQLQKNGYSYQAKLYDTAIGGTPILCAACHSDNALGAAGLPGIGAEASDMHTLHGPQILISNGLTLDQNSATSDLNSCYLCHPGQKTRCKRGAMNGVLCSSCHGNLTYAGNPTRNPWYIEPACQMCHNNSQRFDTTFDTNGQWRQTTDTMFATNDNVPITGANLYRFSTGHGSIYCSGCHGSPHAEYPSLQANDNVYPRYLQKYVAKITECTVCHTSSMTASANRGPHTLHSVGQVWVDSHQEYVNSHGYADCAYCHGKDYRGLALSATKTSRTFTVDDGKVKTFSVDHQFNCYDCHNGPNPG